LEAASDRASAAEQRTHGSESPAASAPPPVPEQRQAADLVEGAVPHACGPIDTSYIEPPGLQQLSAEEEELVCGLTKGRDQGDPLATNPHCNITLRRSDFSRLRGARWLNDELLNSYVALINARNKLHRERATGGDGYRPRTYVFNTYFYTRLMSTGYDYGGVARWSRRAKVNVLELDLILIPVNLGNNHWVLSGIDLRSQCFMYLDSMHGRDSAGVVFAVKQWLTDEVRDKCGVAKANEISVDAWETLTNKYRCLPPRRDVDGTKPPSRPPEAEAHKIPRQRDGGSCGVFTAKIADCLEMGVATNFKQEDMKLIRSRMALDLYRRALPG
jgi:sentrin-specific protease 1